jgi:signal transduction histidine kinase
MGIPLCRRGKAFGVISFIWAESKRSYSEKDLELASELGRRAAVAIENASLYKALQEADEAKDRFIATLAHEFRTPLAAIATVPELVRNTDGDIDTTMRSMDVVERQAERLSRQVEDLLDISRITAGKVNLRKEQVSLANIVSQAIETSRVYIEAANHTLNVLLPEGPTNIFADSLRLEQVFVNILNNAAKFTSAGGQIQVTMESNAHGYITRIKDNGMGISEDMLKNVFNMYMQEKSSSQEGSSGLGIGLALVRKLVELHGGHVEARSAGIGQGSEFIVFLPKYECKRSLEIQPPITLWGRG